MQNYKMRKDIVYLGISGIVFVVIIGYSYIPVSIVKDEASLIQHSDDHTTDRKKKLSLLDVPVDLFTSVVDLIEEPSAAQRLSDDLTVVTAFFNIGSFEKGGPSNIYTSDRYHQWMQIYSKISNNVVAFIDNENDFEFFKQLRSTFPPERTVLELINRNQTRSFQYFLPKIRTIYKDPNYPKHKPNTVIPEYPVIMHFKYEAVRAAIVSNPFKTKYFCWLDIGLFRDIASKNVSTFKLTIPPNMNITQVAYNKVYDLAHMSNKEIFYNNVVYVCGCIFIGEQSVLLRWAEEYLRYARTFLEQGLAGVDQQVVHAMIANEHPKITIQVYTPSGKVDPWFDLGYVCREEGSKA